MVVSNIGFRAGGPAPKLLENKAHQREAGKRKIYMPWSLFVACSEEVGGTPVNENAARFGYIDAGVKAVGNIIGCSAGWRIILRPN